jgi:phospholipase C
MVTRWIRRAIVGAACAVIAAAVFVNAVPRATVVAAPIPSLPQIAGGIHTIKHVIVVMQENRSFDNYFGTFPGADGIPRQGTRPSACLPDPRLGHCVDPFHDVHLIDAGGPHTLQAAREDIDGGRMDGFVRASLEGRQRLCVADPHEPSCGASSQPTPPRT